MPTKRKSKKQELDDQFAAGLAGILNYHHTMLADGVRNKLLYKAIKKCVTRSTSFLDVGAGTGVWAILAAKLGAKRVVAVEIEEALIPMIFKHAQENGVANKIEIIHGRSDDVKIRGKFDVIVSELFGNLAFGEATVKSFIDLRDRFLAPAGVLIPQKAQMLAAPVHLKKLEKGVPAGLPLSSEFARSLKLNYASMLPFSEHEDVRFLAKPETLVDIEFTTVTEPPPLDALSASWRLRNAERANAVVTFQHSVFADGVLMNGFDSQSWGSMVYEFLPFPAGPSELNFKLAISEKGGNWTVSLNDRTDVPARNYSPVFAFARTRMAQKMTPHKRFKGRGPDKK